MNKDLKIELIESILEVISTAQVVITYDFQEEYGNIANWTNVQWDEYRALVCGLNNAAMVLKELKEKL
jgi:hypothetical protein